MKFLSLCRKFFFIVYCLAAEFNSNSSSSFHFSPNCHRLIPVSTQMDVTKTGSQKYPTAGNSQNYDNPLQGNKNVLSENVATAQICVLTVNSSLSNVNVGFWVKIFYCKTLDYLAILNNCKKGANVS